MFNLLNLKILDLALGLYVTFVTLSFVLIIIQSNVARQIGFNPTDFFVTLLMYCINVPIVLIYESLPEKLKFGYIIEQPFNKSRVARKKSSILWLGFWWIKCEKTAKYITNAHFMSLRDIRHKSKGKMFNFVFSSYSLISLCWYVWDLLFSTTTTFRALYYYVHKDKYDGVTLDEFLSTNEDIFFNPINSKFIIFFVFNFILFMIISQQTYLMQTVRISITDYLAWHTTSFSYNKLFKLLSIYAKSRAFICLVPLCQLPLFYIFYDLY